MLTVSNIPEEQLVYNILSSYTSLMKIVDYNKEHQLTYEVTNFIVAKTENSVLCNLLFLGLKLSKTAKISLNICGPQALSAAAKTA